MMTDRYTYSIHASSSKGLLFEFYPDKDPKITWEKGDGQEKFFKRKKIGAVSFTREHMKQDGTYHTGNYLLFIYLWDKYFDANQHTDEMNLYIYDTVKSEYVYKGYFGVKDLKLNLESETFTIKPNLDDKYRWILEVEEQEVDVILESTVGDTMIAKYTYTTEEDVRVINTYAEYQTIIEGGCGFFWDGAPGHEPVWSDPSTWDGTQYHFHRALSRYPIDGWTEVPRYVGSGYDDPRWADCGASEYVETEIEFEFPNCYKLIELPKSAGGNYDSNNKGIIQYLLDEILDADNTSHGLTLKSQFFNTSGGDAINYVTGETNYLQYTLVEQKSDAKDPDATGKATIGKFTFKDLMKVLTNMFNVRWYIDDDDHLVIEHISYFKNGFAIHPPTQQSSCVDLTKTSKYTEVFSGIPYYKGIQDYEWLTVDRPPIETWKFMEEHHSEHRSDFNYIKYDPEVSTTATKKERQVMNVTTDMRYIMARPDDISDDGFVFYNCSNFYDVTDENDVTYHYGNIISLIKYGQTEGSSIGADRNTYLPNAGFGQEHLIPDYWYWDRPYISGKLYLHNPSYGGAKITFNDAEKQLIQKKITFLLHSSDTFDIQKYLRTYRYEFSNSGDNPNARFNKVADSGEIVKAELDLATGYYTVDVAFGIY